MQKGDDGKLNLPVAFFSKKMNQAQQNYSIGEKEMLGIVEVLKSFRSLLYGQTLNIYTDHKNLTFERFQNERTRRWRQYVEDFAPRLEYIPGERNAAADCTLKVIWGV